MASLVDRLRDLIHQREYEAGERLPSERELAAHFHVSRPTVRRAISALVEHGIIEARDRSGMYLRTTDRSELLAARLALEPWAAHEATLRCTDEDRERLGELLRQAREHLTDEQQFSAADRQIHDVLFVMTRNSIMIDLYGSLRERVAASRGRTATLPETRAQSLEDLTTLVGSVVEGDAVGARSAMARHLERLDAATRQSS